MSLETVAEPSWLLYRRLHHSESSLRSVNMITEPLTLGPDLDNCLVQQLQEQVGRLRAELSDVTCDIPFTGAGGPEPTRAGFGS